MKTILSLVGLIAAMILTGCGAPAPDVEGQDWCYLFDFTENPQGFLLTTGTWTSQGIISDATGLLQTSYGYDRFVEPSFVIVTVVRPTGVTGDISATAAGTIFGLSASFTATLPGGTDEAQLTFTPSAVGQAGTDVNITVDASQPIGIESIDVRGMGGSPFNFNPCSDATPTPFGITPSGTATSAITATPDGSITPTITPTTCQTSTPAPDDWILGTVLSHTGNTWVVEAQFTGGGVYVIQWGYTTAWGGESLWSSFSMVSGSISSATILDEDGTSILFADLPEVVRYFDMGSPGPMTVQFEFDYDYDPTGGGCGPTPTPSVTPTLATSTPGPTYTPQPLWSACLDFTQSNFSFTGTDATYEAGTGWIQDEEEWSIGRAGVGPSGKKKFRFTFDGAWSGSIRLTNTGGTPSTGWKLGSGSQFILDFSDQVWTPTQNLFVEFDGNYGPYALEEMCWVDLNPSTPTPGPGSTNTPSGTRTPLPTGTARPNPSRTPVQVPIPIIIITSTSGVQITTTPIYGGTGVYYATGTPVMTGTPMGTPASNGTGFGSGGGGFGDVGDMLGFGWNIGLGLFNALFAYLGQATTAVTNLLSAFANATPQPIPGLPLCMTNPMAHDICAIYYVMDNTLLAPATPGQYIVPLMQIVFNVGIVIFFVRFVLRIIRRGEDVTRVD